MKKHPLALDGSYFTYIGSMYPDYSFGVNCLLNGCKRLKAKILKCILNECKRLMKDVFADNQGFTKIISVLAIGEMRV